MKQVIVIRKDLNMRRGKEIAQGAHASCQFLLDAALAGKQLTNAQLKWAKSGMKKVCVQVSSEKELLDLYDKARQLGVTVSLITDAGHTEFNGVPTQTAVAVGPDEEEVVDMITKELKLY